MATTTYGTGTALQFTDATQRQVLELGDKIHYYNPEVTPIFTLFGMGKTVTPVPIFEWMEDEYFIKRSVKIDMAGGSAGADSATTILSDTATSLANGENAIINFPKQSDVEAFEVGGIYSGTFTGTAAFHSPITHLICIAIGDEVNCTTTNPKAVQFMGAHIHTSLNAYFLEEVAASTDMIGFNTDSTLTLDYVATAGRFYEAGTATAYYGYNTHSGTKGFGEINFDDDDYFMIEGGAGQYAEGASVGTETRKKVRRLKNCTQIFREPYTITNTAKVSEHYGGDELSRLQSRKLAKIKTDIEYSLLTNGAISLDASVENPKRTFQGLGVGGTAGAIQTNNGDATTSCQVSEGSETLVQWEQVMTFLFDDMISGSMKKTVFCSNRWLVELARLTRLEQGNYEIGSEIRSGIRVRKYLGPIGELEFIPHPLLSGGLGAYAVAVDPANFAIRPLNGRDMQLRSDIVLDGRDGQTDEWLMEMGMEMRNEQTHAILKLV